MLLNLQYCWNVSLICLTFTNVIGVVVPSMSSKSALVQGGIETVAIFRIMQQVS